MTKVTDDFALRCYHFKHGAWGSIMLYRTDQKLRSYFNNDPLLGADGQFHDMDGVTRIDRRQCERLAELHKEVRPDLSVETGLAYGFSSLPMLDAMQELDYGHHIAIDPSQTTYWHGIALTAIEELGFSKRFTWICAPSDEALPKLIAEKRRAQLVFFDGVHTFDGIMTDFFLADQLVDQGGLMILNNMWLPSIRALASFIQTNLTHYDVIPAAHANMFVVKKARPDFRSWDHFAPFDSAGRQKTRSAGLFAKLFGA